MNVRMSEGAHSVTMCYECSNGGEGVTCVCVPPAADINITHKIVNLKAF